MIVRGLIALLLFVFAAAGTAAAESRGIAVVLKESDKAGARSLGKVQLYGSSHALVIGNDAYDSGWPRLSNGIRDAELVAGELSKRGFQVRLEKDLDSSRLKSVLEEFFVLNGADPEARLFVWFAGHGHTIDGEGYLVPTDAPRPDDVVRFKLKALNMRRFGEFVRQAVSKHAFAVFDSCFSGTVFDSQRALPPAAITRATALPARQFLTSGDADQEVSDDGTFRELFLRALRGEEKADANGDGYVTATEVGLFLADRVTNLTQSRQTPRYGKLRDKDFDRGDFVFVSATGAGADLPPPAPKAAVSAAPAVDRDALFWSSVKDSTDPGDFEAYLGQFPNGTFATLAHNRIDQLRAQPAPPASAPRTAPVSRTAPVPRGVRVDAVDVTYVAVKNANVRAAPETAGALLGTVPQGDPVRVTGKVQGRDWYRIEHGGGAGYVYAPLLGVAGARSAALRPGTAAPAPRKQKRENDGDDALSLLIIGEDNGRDTLGRKSEPFRAFAGGLAKGLRKKGFKARLLPAQQDRAPNRIRRDNHRMANLARRSGQGFDGVVVLSLRIDREREGRGMRLEPIAVARLVEVETGEQVGEAEWAAPRPIRAKRGCDDSCQLDMAKRKLPALGRDFAARMAEAIADAVEDAEAGGGEEEACGQERYYTVGVANLPDHQVDGVEDLLGDLPCAGDLRDRPSKRGKAWSYLSGLEGTDLEEHLREALQDLGSRAKVTRRGAVFWIAGPRQSRSGYMDRPRQRR